MKGQILDAMSDQFRVIFMRVILKACLWVRQKVKKHSPTTPGEQTTLRYTNIFF